MNCNSLGMSESTPFKSTSIAFVSGEFFVLFGLLGVLFLGGRRGWKTGGGLNGIGGLIVRLWVGQVMGEDALTFLIGETFQFRSSQGEICWPIKCSLSLCDGLLRVVVDPQLTSKCCVEVRGETLEVRGVASRSSRLINKLVVALRRVRDMVPEIFNEETRREESNAYLPPCCRSLDC